VSQKFLNTLGMFGTLEEHRRDPVSKVMEAKARQAKLVTSAVKPPWKLAGILPRSDG
jgi:hypothetical protein